MQRIINSSVHSSTGASPASLLFGNQLNLDRGILTKTPENPGLPTKASSIIANMLLIQEQLNNDATTQLQSADQNRVSTNTLPQIEFEVDSYVLALNPNGPLTRLHTKWQGPFKVVKHVSCDYSLFI